MILKDILTQYKNYVYLEDEKSYSQLTISNNGIVSHRDIKKGAEIGRKRQFVIDLISNPYTLIFTRQGVVEGSIGLVPQELDGYIVTENMPMFSINTSLVNPQYLLMFLKSKIYKEQIRKIIPSGTAQKALHEDKWTLIEIELPSFEQQNEIVNKYLTCLPHLERISEKALKQEKYIFSLRQSILQQAVEGKLCEQDPTDEPASVLLEKIKVEKEKLIAEKKIKKQKVLPPITEEEKPFDLPYGWEWCRLEEVSSKITDGSHNPPPNAGYGYPVISAKNIKNGSINLNLCDRFTDEKGFLSENRRTNIKSGDIIMGIIGGSIGNIAIYDLDAKVIAQRSISIIDTLISNLYCSFVLRSEYMQKFFLQTTSGTAQGGLYLGQISDLLFPIPPLTEQQRIVEKVDKLMALCDELEQEVTNAKKYATQLMEAVLQEAFSGKPKPEKDNVIVFAPQIQDDDVQVKWNAAARGGLREDTWHSLVKRANQIVKENH